MTKRIDIYDDDINSITEYLQVSNILAEHNKDHIAKNIIENGENLLNEIDKRTKLREIEKDQYIKKIIKLKKNKYSIDELKSYSLKDVVDIYDLIKYEKNNFINKIFNFFG